MVKNGLDKGVHYNYNSSKTVLKLIVQYQGASKPVIKQVTSTATGKMPTATKKQIPKPWEKAKAVAAQQSKNSLYALAESLSELHRVMVIKK